MAEAAISERDRQIEVMEKFTSWGCKLFSLYRPTPTGCSCGNRKCGSPGKHPIEKGWQDAAVSDLEKARLRIKREHNIGIKTGDNLIVVDVDDNKDGGLSLKRLQAEHGELPNTLTVKTGNGYHLYFWTKEKIKNSVSMMGDGIDIRGEGGYVVGPSSEHKSGITYEIDTTRASEPTWAPAWLLSLCKRKTLSKKNGPDEIIEGGRNNYLISVAGAARRKGTSEPAILAMLMAENAVRCRPPLDEYEVRQIASNASQFKTEFDANDWKSTLQVDRNGVIKNSRTNIGMILQYDDDWSGSLCYDVWEQRPRWVNGITLPSHVWQPKPGSLVEGKDEMYVSSVISNKYGSPPAVTTDVMSAIEVVSRANEIDAIKTYLHSLEWDRTHRLEFWLKRALGVKDTEYASIIGKKWLIGAVARALEPGCKMDYMIVLEGHQGTGKSTVGAILAQDYFKDGPLISGKGDYVPMNIMGAWIYEASELSGIKGKALEAIKAFITDSSDTGRLPYGRTTVTIPRRCVFLGTTNEYTYLEDTANRRFWPVKIRQLDAAWLMANRDQLWAEAVYCYKKGDKWWPEGEAESKMVSTEQEKRRINDPWGASIYDFIVTRWRARPEEDIDNDDLFDLVGLEKGHRNVAHGKRLGAIMESLGWLRKRSAGSRGFRATEKWRNIYAQYGKATVPFDTSPATGPDVDIGG
jgi:hypothetical protein